MLPGSPSSDNPVLASTSRPAPPLLGDPEAAKGDEAPRPLFAMPDIVDSASHGLGRRDGYPSITWWRGLGRQMVCGLCLGGQNKEGMHGGLHGVVVWGVQAWKGPMQRQHLAKLGQQALDSAVGENWPRGCLVGSARWEGPVDQPAMT